MAVSVDGLKQTKRYDDFYTRFKRVRWLFRFDVRYRVKRLHEAARELGISLEGARVLDVGFGAGHLLASFPPSCKIHGIDVSSSAIRSAKEDPRFAHFAQAEFTQIAEQTSADALPQGPFDIVISSHVLEHVPEDRAMLAAIFERLRPGGHLFLFVPLEAPGYNPDHIRTYCPTCIQRSAEDLGFDVRLSEPSFHLGGHLWKYLTLPSRRRWPVLWPLTDAWRMASMSLVPYKVMRGAEKKLNRLGIDGRQLLTVAQKPGSPRE